MAEEGRAIHATFSAVDYVVFSATLVISAAVGVYFAFFGNKKNTTAELLFGERSMRILPVATSILVTSMSAITILGIPAEVYQFGTQYWMIGLAYCLVIPACAHLYLPIYYRLRISSIFEYLERRFNKVVRTIAFVVNTAYTLVYTAFVIFAPSVMLAQATGLHFWICVLSIGVVCTFYTTIGGIQAVVWTDVFQGVIIFASVLTILIKGVHDLGGIQKVWDRARTGQRIEFFNFNPDPTVRTTFWSILIGGLVIFLSVYSINQPMIQRMVSVPTLRGAQTTVWLNLPGLLLALTITCLIGLVLYAQYHDCDPAMTQRITTKNQMLPLFVMDSLASVPGISGLFVAGVVSGSLSTLSSVINSLSAVTSEDLVKQYIAPQMSEKTSLRLVKGLALGYGVIGIVLVAVVEVMSGSVLEATLRIFGATTGPMLGIFTLGMLFPWPNATGAIIGFLSGTAAAMWICVGAIVYKTPHPSAPVSVEGCMDLFLNVTTPTNHTLTLTASEEEVFVLYRISYLWYGTIGTIVTIIVGLIASCLTGNNKKDLDPELFFPFSKLWISSKKKNKNKGTSYRTTPFMEVYNSHVSFEKSNMKMLA